MGVFFSVKHLCGLDSLIYLLVYFLKVMKNTTIVRICKVNKPDI